MSPPTETVIETVNTPPTPQRGEGVGVETEKTGSASGDHLPSLAILAKPEPVSGAPRVTTAEKNQKPSESLPFASKEFAEAWGAYVEHRASMTKAKRLNPNSTRLALKKLAGLTERQAIETLEASVMNGWQGLFPKTENNGHTSKSSNQNFIPAKSPGSIFRGVGRVQAK